MSGSYIGAFSALQEQAGLERHFHASMHLSKIPMRFRPSGGAPL